MFVIPKGLLKIRQVPILMRKRNSMHALALTELSIFHRKLDGEK